MSIYQEYGFKLYDADRLHNLNAIFFNYSNPIHMYKLLCTIISPNLKSYYITLKTINILPFTCDYYHHSTKYTFYTEYK